MSDCPFCPTIEELTEWHVRPDEDPRGLCVCDDLDDAGVEYGRLLAVYPGEDNHGKSMTNEQRNHAEYILMRIAGELREDRPWVVIVWDRKTRSVKDHAHIQLMLEGESNWDKEKNT